MPLAWLGDIASLEERMSRLEETNARLQAVAERNDNIYTHGLDSSRAIGESHTIHSEEDSQRKVSFASRVGPEASLARSSPAIGLLATFARSEEDSLSPLTFHDGSATRRQVSPSYHDAETSFDRVEEEALFSIYHDKVHCRYPFLRLDDFRNPASRYKEKWTSYFTNMIFSIGLLLEKTSYQSEPRHHSHQALYRLAVTQYLSHVFAQPDRLLHIQAYLLLAMHAIYSPSTERIISIASATMRYCIMAQLHLADAEPSPPLDVTSKIRVQMRRRVFWSAYTLDRAVGTMFDLPFSVPDYQITVKMYANIDEMELEAACATSYSLDPYADTPRLTSVSAAIHVVYCRRIQSEILNTTLHRNFSAQFDGLSYWRLRVLEKLHRWRALCHQYADTRSRNFTSSEWLHMIYNYSLAMLYQPTKTTVMGPAGDWTVKSCVQACLIFRKFQRETPITELWLGLIAQFKCGVALLYCFFATPPHLRTAAYRLPDVYEAVRACSIILSILAERWPQSKCLRDAFDILAREIPLSESSTIEFETVGPRKMRKESADALRALINQLEIVVVHRNTLRMINEMAQDDFPRPLPDGSKSQTQEEALADITTQLTEECSPPWRTSITGDMFQPITPHFFQANVSGLDAEAFDYAALGFPGEFDLFDG
ncbi:zn 2cys6 transcription factor [Colletotrichum incanum]|uniref:Zn 2cys6 transcription factor n=1 Tax=Colletotrichum incanum TaxID=1573173 RepID=A0A167C6X0_COLIC|nr:zn 2cys6 transcription factor [Colletotrichum incanum]